MANRKKASEKRFNSLQPDKLRWQCPDAKFKFETTEEIEPLDNIVGQPRALEALRLGSELHAKGYNIFVTGLSGTGRLTTVRKMLEDITTYCPQTYDYCYVNNFEDPDRPRLIKLPAGMGKKFAGDMSETVDFLKRRLPQLFQEKGMQTSRRKIIEKYQEKERDVLKEFDEKIEPHGFVRGQLEAESGATQPEVFPVVEDEPVPIDQLDKFVSEGKIKKDEAEKKRELYKKFHTELYEVARKGMKLMQEFRKTLMEHDKSAAALVVNSVFEEIKNKYKDPKVDEYAEQCKKYVLDNLGIFVQSEESAQKLGDHKLNPQFIDVFNSFEVNVVLDNSETKCAPVVVETTPSYTNLFGSIERVFDKRGFWRSDFTRIKAGSLLKADQGYLIVNALDLFSEPGVWPALKRVLLYDKLEIQPFENYMQLTSTTVKPEAIDIKVKVIIIGGQSLYTMLYLHEKGFKKIFKVNAQFDYETERTDEMLEYYARFVSKICRDDNLPHCTPDGVAAIAEWAVERAGAQNRITLKFSDVADIVREAAFYDRGSDHKFINREDVQKAIEERRFRNDLIDSKLKKRILEETIMIDTDGERIGQINGLTIINNGIFEFGKPARITASISAGNAGIINIEREADMSGSIHNKGLLIISGFMREKFAAERPLSFTASIAFEQSYSGIDGDSASAAEIYVLLSALTEVTIRQDKAITGSVNQKGDIQPIGGVNEKIRGFFEICDERGLTGDQGVIIPHQNVKDLMLADKVVKAVKAGKFHIYPIANIDEGCEILMGIKAGSPTKTGKYPKGTLYHKVSEKIAKLHEIAKKTKQMESKSGKK
ncbi:MAG: Lon protease family protein [Candidatus Kapaibacterium sp.]